MAVPDSSPRAFSAVSVRNPRRLVLSDGTFFPPGCCAVPWGRASAPVGVAPEALECEYSCKVFPQHIASVRGVCFSQLRQYFNQPRRCHVHISAFSRVFDACRGGVAVYRAPEPGPTRGDRGELSVLSVRPFAALSQGGGVRCLRLPSIGSRIVDPSLSC
jgi:hypothetical protein